MNKYHKMFAQNIEEWEVDENGQGKGKCPFHNDQHPSFSGNENTGLWICFACGASGNAKQFLQRLNNESK